MNYFLSRCTLQDIVRRSDIPLKIFVLDGTSSYIKSRFLFRLAINAATKGLSCERFLSKQDYDKLAAIYIKSLNIFIIDRIYFSETINNYSNKIISFVDTDNIFLSTGVLPDDENEKLIKSKTEFLSKAAKFENAAAGLFNENRNIFLPYLDKAKVLNYILRFVSRNGLTQHASCAENTLRCISAVTPWGIHTCCETIMQSCKTIAVIRDEYKCVSSVLTGGLAQAFNQCGFETETYCCSLCEECTEHLIVPSLSLAFFTENRNHSYPFNDTGILNIHRFMKSELTPSDRISLQWNCELADDFLDEAVFSLFDAMECDNAICDEMSDRLDETAFNELFDELNDNVFNR